MVIALFTAMVTVWWFLWGIFHLAGGAIHLVLAAAFLLLVYRTVQASRLRLS